MNFKTNIRLFITYFIVLISVTFWVVTVFWTDLIFVSQIKDIEVLSNNVFSDDRKMQNNYIFFSSNSDLSNYKLASSCKIKSNFLWEKDNKYAFKITYLDNCPSWLVYLETEQWVIIKNSFFKMNLFNKSNLFELFVDRRDADLDKTIHTIRKNINKLSKDLKKHKYNKNLNTLKLERKILEFKYQENFLSWIIASRQLKYIVPVKWYKISDKKNEIPNSGRPYRNNYTDWIHHGWDIVAPNNTEVIALDDSKVIKIVSDFTFDDLKKLKKTWNITLQDKHKNLDILRGNQVWLKTSKWDVVFYSHLSTISQNLKVWDLVSVWTVLWKIWITWVPDRNYKNYHLHFAVMKNPYLKNKVWKYTNIDYLNWDWYFKGKSLEYVIENQKNIFN